ncbi:MAG: 4-(cytidine 5'-diphospho)-2-C-methyl-D-erythritol kinase [Clostridia bacterium]|nr:4-(cytidine 5'-diphospho)-2-C-methyl-D-erythritol kinase [Clostridia bacterium]
MISSDIKRLKIKANAKINLTLAITGKREDGYHLIDTVMQSVSLGDTVLLKKNDKISVKCKGVDISEADNIAFKAAKLFFNQTGLNGGASIKIKKQIPDAAGMGGGSADAAAVLVGLNRLYKSNLSTEKLEQMALELGADVPFFIRGGTMRAEGIGEILTELKPFLEGYFVLVKEGKKPSTKEMYNKVDNENPPMPDNKSFIKALESGDLDKASGYFENSFSIVWKENELPKRLMDLGAVSASLSGSGPTNFGWFKDEKTAKSAFKAIKKENKKVYLVKPLNCGLEIFE